jgi:hypothetical protein
MEKFLGERKEEAVRHLNDPGTFEAIAQVEGPAWVELQNALTSGDDHVNPNYYETSFQRAVDRLKEGKSSEIHGHGGMHHWLVGRDGVVRFLEQQAAGHDQEARKELLDRVRALGFDIHPSSD